MFLKRLKRALMLGVVSAVMIPYLRAADPVPTNSATELQSGQRFDLQKITGAAPQTNAESNNVPPASYAFPVVIISPTPNEIAKGKTVEVKIEGVPSHSRPYHVIVNNESPVLLKEDAASLVLDGLNPGGNLLRVFSVTSEGKIGPMPQSFAMTYFYFHKRDFSNIARQGQPFLSVNLPMDGPALADAKGRVCFDYFVHNAKIGGKDGLKIKYSLNQREEILDKAGPHFWGDLSPGKYTLTAELIDAAGSPVLGTYCKVERAFEISRIMKPLELEKEDSVLRELMNRPQTNSVPSATNPPANFTTTNAPAPAPPATPEKKNKTLKVR